MDTSSNTDSINSDATKVVVLGQGGVGKTCLILRLRNDEFDENYVPTLQDTYHKDLNIDGKSVKLGMSSYE